MQDAAMLYPPITPAWTNLAAAVTIEHSKKPDHSCTSPNDHRYDSSSPPVDRLSPRSATSSSSSSSISPSRMPPKKRYARMRIVDSPPPEQPIVNCHQGKVKKYRCNRCPHVSITKRNLWSHSRKHIQPEQLLTCPECSFVTEHRHQLETHALTHSKTEPPFECPECEYSAASKRALNGHLKSHSSLLPYRCSGCKFASKFGHRLRLHLEKSGHAEGFVLSGDGSFDPRNVIVSSSRKAMPLQQLGAPVDSLPAVPVRDDNALPICFDATLAIPSAADDFDDDQVVPEARELVEQTTPVDYSRRSPSPAYEEFDVESPIDLSGRTSTPLDLSKTEEPKNDEWLDCTIEDARDENMMSDDDLQQQIQHLRANLASMHQCLWTLEQNVLY